MNLTLHINIAIKDTLPKYACRNCGSHEVRGDFDTYPVFQAEGDKLVFQRKECPDGSVLVFYCTDCHEPIEIENVAEVKIE